MLLLNEAVVHTLVCTAAMKFLTVHCTKVSFIFLQGHLLLTLHLAMWEIVWEYRLCDNILNN